MIGTELSMGTIADIKASEMMDRLVITPREANKSHVLGRLLKESLPGVHLHRSTEGLWVKALDADRLLNIASDIDLRWTPDSRRFAENIQHAKRANGGLWGEIGRIRSGGLPVAVAYLTDIEGLEILDGHQVVNVAAMTLDDGYGLCVFDEQGTGKTITLIYAFDVLSARDKVDAVLILAPKSMVPEWPNDFTRFKGDLYKVGIMAGSRQAKRAVLTSGFDVIVTNFETAVSMEQELKAYLRRFQGRAMLAVDESFYVKSLDAKRTRAVRRLREYCQRAYVLCGTPAPNSPHDLIQQFNIVDFGLTFDGIKIPDERELARPVIQHAIEQRGLFIRHLKRDVLPDLPEKRFQKVIVPLQPEQTRLYQGALKNLLVDLRATDDKTFQKRLGSFLAKRNALLQICSNPVSIANGYSEIPCKLQALDSLLEELIVSKGEKVILWSFYTASIDAIMNRYSRFQPVRFDGSVSDVKERRESVRKFQEDKITMLFVANPAAAGAGLTLHRARVSIYESMSNQAAHYLQSLDRIHRRGQTRDVEYLVLLCDRTIEIQEYEALIRKENASRLLLGDDPHPSMSREVMLQDALAAMRLFGATQ